jgi:diacylglycerol kinase (ATP)
MYPIPFQMNAADNHKFLFIINRSSGTNTPDWQKIIADYFTAFNHIVEVYQLPNDFNVKSIIEKIVLFSPNRVIAVGGDGTIKLVAECLMHTKTPLGILPAGSANGLAKELHIPEDPAKALDVIVTGHLKKIHLIKINNHICVHLSDIGLNAHAVKKFEKLPRRGMWGYVRAAWKVVWVNPVMLVNMQMANETSKQRAHMIVIANATQYGSGAVINPIGKLDDNLFEIIVVKKISLRELFKMIFSHNAYDSTKTEVFQTNTLRIRSTKKVHFQIDGEYLGKVNEVNATLLPDAIEIIVPNTLISTVL